jgi:beta-phosphoglucomutase family hydrolase
VLPPAESASPLADGLALIFDMDGVIVDSNPLHREAWIAFNRRYGLETTEAMLQGMYGRRNDRIVRDFFGDSLSGEEVAARGAAKEELYRQMVAGRVERMLVPGLRTFLDFYRGAPLAVASNAEPENVNFLLDRAGLRPYFRVVVDGHQAIHPKPHPEIYQRAAALLEIAPANCIVFEDSHTGIAAARAAGMRVAGIRTTEVSLPGADVTADNFLSGSLTLWLRAQKPAE